MSYGGRSLAKTPSGSCVIYARIMECASSAVHYGVIYINLVPPREPVYTTAHCDPVIFIISYIHHHEPHWCADVSLSILTSRESV